MGSCSLSIISIIIIFQIHSNIERLSLYETMGVWNKILLSKLYHYLDFSVKLSSTNNQTITENQHAFDALYGLDFPIMTF